MKFYSRYPGDIGIKTGHLTPAEFGAYDRLLDHYYATEKPIDPKRVYGIVRCQTAADRAATDAVLSEFWTLTDDGWVQGRADEVIAQARPRIDAARANGRKGGRPPGSKKKPTGFSEETQGEPTTKTLQSPITNGGSTDVEHPPAGVSPYAAVCIALKAAGIAAVNPGHPMLRTLVDAGADVVEFIGAVKASEGKADRFAYVLGVVEGQRKRAASTAGTIHRGPLRVVGKQAALEAHNRAVAEAWAHGESDAG